MCTCTASIETIVIGMWSLYPACSNELEPHEEQLPDIMWCRDPIIPIMEQLNEIEAMDGTRN